MRHPSDYGPKIPTSYIIGVIMGVVVWAIIRIVLHVVS